MVLPIVGIRLASRLVRGQGCWRLFAAAEDSSSPIKSFTSDRAADDHVYRCDNDENDDCNHKNNS